MVFEDMIDTLISDDTKDKNEKLKDQPDGKIVDHIYHYGSLVRKDDIYYIGDSKYYKEGHDPGENSIYKQFTYAKNVIQMNMDVTSSSEQIGRGNYYDDVTEGYNITPNFFIRGIVNPLHLNYIEAELEQEEDKEGNPAVEKRFHHVNRLFDRDTLFVLKYSINFLFVLSAYASGRVDEAYRNRIREKFKKNLIEELKRKYHFYLLQSKGDRMDAVDKHFRLLNGKVFSAFNDERALLFAYEKGKHGVIGIFEEIKPDFNLYNYKLGQDVHDALKKKELSSIARLWEKTKTQVVPLISLSKYLSNNSPVYNHLTTLFCSEVEYGWKDITSIWSEDFDFQANVPEMNAQIWNKLVSQFRNEIAEDYSLDVAEV